MIEQACPQSGLAGRQHLAVPNYPNQCAGSPSSARRLISNLSVSLLIGLFVDLGQLRDARAAYWCFEPLLQGFEQEYARADAVLPKDTTHDMNKVAIYVERAHDGNLYFQSNYIVQGMQNPTKVAEVKDSEAPDLSTIFGDIVFHSKHEPTDTEKLAAVTAMKSTRLILDSSLFGKDGRLPFDTEGVVNVRVVDHGQSSSLPATELYSRGSPPPAWIVNVSGCCLFIKPPARAAGLISRLEAIPFHPDDFTLIPLVIDSATERAIAGSRLGRQAAKLDFSGDIRSQVTKVMANSQGKTVAILGHVESSHFVILDAHSKVVGRLPISELNELARKHDISLIEAGCNTAKEVGRNSGSLVVVNNKFRAVDAVGLLDEALNGSTNFAQFLQHMASPSFTMVIDENGLRSTGKVSVNVYGGTGSVAHVAAQVGLLSIAFTAATQQSAIKARPSDETEDVKFDRDKQLLEALKRALSRELDGQ